MSNRTRNESRREMLRRLGQNVRARRLERGLTQEKLAHELAISVAYVSLIERGGRNPPFTTVIAIAHALRVSPRELVDLS
jgi:transcriptional regulator with XRE-family HTH domain